MFAAPTWGSKSFSRMANIVCACKCGCTAPGDFMETLWRPTTTFLHLLALFRLKGPNERPGFKDACSDPGTETHIASWSRLTKVLGCTVKEPVLLHWESKPTKQSCNGLPLSQKFQVITGCPTKLGLQTPWVLLRGSRNLGDCSATLSL